MSGIEQVYLPLYYNENGIVIRTFEAVTVSPTGTVYQFRSSFSIPHWSGFGLLMVYDKKEKAVSGHYKWAKLLPKLFREAVLT